MRVNGLTLIYKDGINTVLSNNSASYPVGDLLCRIFQGETLYNISRIVRNCVSVYPMRDILLSQDEIEQAEDYILQSLMYDEFYPARHLSQGSFIRCIEEYRSLDSASQSRLIQEEKQRAEMGGQFFKDIGFNTIGEFLQLCFNNYYVDLINGTSLFTATSAVWSGTATEEERALYDELCRTRIGLRQSWMGLLRQALFCLRLLLSQLCGAALNTRFYQKFGQSLSLFVTDGTLTVTNAGLSKTITAAAANYKSIKSTAEERKSRS